MTSSKRKRRVFSVSVYCRNESAVLLVHQDRLWGPIEGELKTGETPLEAAERIVWEQAGFEDQVYPHIHSVLGAPPGLLLYEEHDAGSCVHLNFTFIAEVPHRVVRSGDAFVAVRWIGSLTDLPREVPAYVQDAMPYALSAGVL